MSTMILATFDDRAHLRSAIDGLFDHHVSPEEVGVIVAGPAGKRRARVRFRSGLTRGAGVGVALGALVGASGAAMVATGLFTLPGAGFLAASPLLAAGEGAITGAGLGGLAGAMAGLSVWTEEIDVDEAQLADARAMLGVTAEGERVDELEQVLDDAGGRGIRRCDPAIAPRPILRAIATR